MPIQAPIPFKRAVLYLAYLVVGRFVRKIASPKIIMNMTLLAKVRAGLSRKEGGLT